MPAANGNFPKFGVPFSGPHKKDRTILGAHFGVPLFKLGNYQIQFLKLGGRQGPEAHIGDSNLGAMLRNSHIRIDKRSMKMGLHKGQGRSHFAGTPSTQSLGFRV